MVAMKGGAHMGPWPLRRALFGSLFLLFFALSGPSPASAERPSFPTLSEKDEQRLRAGKLVLLTEASGSGRRMVTGVIQIEAEQPAIWRVILSNQNIVGISGSATQVDFLAGPSLKNVFFFREALAALHPPCRNVALGTSTS